MYIRKWRSKCFSKISRYGKLRTNNAFQSYLCGSSPHSAIRNYTLEGLGKGILFGGIEGFYLGGFEGVPLGMITGGAEGWFGGTYLGYAAAGACEVGGMYGPQ